MIRNLIKYFKIYSCTTKNIEQKPFYKIQSLKYLSKNFCNLPNVTNEEPGYTTADSNNKPIDREKMLKILYLEVDVARQEGRRVPDPELMQEKHWDNLLNLKSRSARIKYYAYLWEIEKKRENQEIKKVERAKELVERKAKLLEEKENNHHIIYGLSHTSFFLRIYDSTINLWQNNKLISAMQFGPKIVLDCGYDDNMNEREASNTAKQLMLLFAENRFDDEPFDLHFCNVSFDKNVMKSLQSRIPTVLEPAFPLNIHQTCFTNIFPKDKIVYLTPHCKNDLVTYDPDDVYVIGAIVDKVNNEPLSLAKAKRLGLRMARLPLDRYLSWSSGSGKSLTLDQMLNIMLDFKRTSDWKFALRHVPRRKIIDNFQQKRVEKKLRTRANKFEFDVSTWGNANIEKNNPFKNK